MFSVIVSTYDKNKLNNILLPSLDPIKKHLKDNHFPELQIVLVEGKKGLTENYNKGLDQSKFKLKIFIHEDIDIMDVDPPLFMKIHALFTLFPNTGLIGLIGTTENVTGFWWSCSKKSIVGHVQHLGEIEEYLTWRHDEVFYSGIEYVDGFFMATTLDIRFSEDIDGFHFYGSDYCNMIKREGYDIKVIPHLVKHYVTIKSLTGTNIDYYNRKWNLIS